MDQLPLTMDFSRIGLLSDEEFFLFCESNRNLRFERSSEGLITVMAPTGFWTGRLNAKILQRLSNWNELKEGGNVVDSSTGFLLPDKAVFSPDASWISHTRLAEVREEDLKRHLPACPEFVVELASPSDSVFRLKKKMKNWTKNGVLLAWLIDPETETAFVFRPNKNTLEYQGFDRELSADPVLPGFSLDLRELRG
jgi:Uma2 family endonuclease